MAIRRKKKHQRLTLENLEDRRVFATCIDFEGLPLGNTYSVGDSFVADNTGFSAQITARPFTFSDGRTTSGGFAEVENGGFAGDVGHELEVNNILLEYNFQQPVADGFTMNFGEYGGNLNMLVNGVFQNFENFNQIDGANFGGVQISVTNGFGNDQGVLELDGPVTSFAIGGQELYIDHLCLRQDQGVLDWGDAPDSPNGPAFYNTLAANNGAFHVISDVHFLGAGVDGESDGQPTNSALGDDLNGGFDDEDGVKFLTALIPGMDAEVEVTANEDGFLSAWMDFQGDGKWDPSDQIFSVEFLTAGTHVLSFPVPSDAEIGNTYSRWRFTNEEVVIGPEGAGPASGERMFGEVEDYRNQIDNPDCIDFEEMPLGSTFFVGDTFVADTAGFNAQFRGERFTFSDGTVFAGGFAEIQNGGLAGDSGQEVAVNNILMDANFGSSIPGLMMEFGEYGGNLNLEINGDFRNFDNFVDIHGAVIGGTNVTIPVGGFGNDTGTLIVDGTINSFKFGGQELWVDHICLYEGSGDELDWGDAPDSPNGPAFYNTLAANNGAFHVIDDLHFLGTAIDGEADGQPTNSAQGDDVAGVPDDEDGVKFLTPIVPGSDARVEVTANEDGFLSAWMDFQGDGKWDATDQIFTVEFLSPGSHILSFPVPADAKPGATYSRWRFTDQQLVIGPDGPGTVTGEALFGEVEDYRNLIDNKDCIDFEDLPLGATYVVGDVFTADSAGFSAQFRGEPFIFDDGTPFPGGVAEIQNGGLAGNAGQEVAVNNILLNANFGAAIPGLMMEFGEYGGNLNLEINGDFRNFANFADVNGAVIGGTIVTVPVGGFGNDTGTLVVDGTINSFKFGGQELWVDHICLYEGQGGDELDWGDAPDRVDTPFQYNTLASNNGAVHLIDNVHFLGDTVDGEVDGQPTIPADGDDLAGSDDEDGVKFLTPWIPGKVAEVEVFAAADGFLSSWVDFDQNGQWDAADQVHAVQFLPAGSHILQVPIPGQVEPGRAYSRWRFTSQQLVIGPAGTGSPFGLIDGEVEDYQGRFVPGTDFDDDGDCDCDDVDALVNNIAAGVYDPAMDLNADGTLNTDDLNIWLTEAALKNGLPSAYLPGDANLDGVVDASDFNIWNGNKFTSGGGWCGGDFNADGVTDISDFNIWNANKFMSSTIVAGSSFDHIDSVFGTQDPNTNANVRRTQPMTPVARESNLDAGIWSRVTVSEDQEEEVKELDTDSLAWMNSADEYFGSLV